MFSPASWLRQQFWQRLWKGPGAVSTYLSMPVPVICVAISAVVSSEIQGVSLCILSITLVLGALLVLVDEIDFLRNHCLGLLRFSAAESRDRIQKLGINSKRVDRFVNALWLNPEIKLGFQRTRLQSVELIVEGDANAVQTGVGRFYRLTLRAKKTSFCSEHHSIGGRAIP